MAETASPVYHLEGGVYGWYTAFGDEGFIGKHSSPNTIALMEQNC